MAGSFLFVTYAGGGNVPPTVGVARRLIDRGHRVRVLGAPELEAAFEGCEFSPFERALAPVERAAALLTPSRHPDLYIGGEVGIDLLAAVDGDRPDVAVIDCMLVAALAAARSAGLPTAALVHFLYGGALRADWTAVWTPLIPLFNETRASFGLGPLDDGGSLWRQQWDEADLVVVLTQREFDAPAPTANARYAGPVLDASDWRWDLPWPPDQPFVLVSSSTTQQNQRDVLRRTVDALAGTGMRMLVTLGPQLRTDELATAPNVVIRTWVPHAAVLPHATVFVTHAGHGSVMAGLAAGVPMVCMPMGRDQYATAERVEATGTGVTIDPAASASEIRRAVEAVAADRAFRASAARFADVIRGSDGASAAASELERLLD